MKKIYITLIALVMAMVGMAYLYFSRLNTETSYNDTSLSAATANSGLIFCIENDRSVFDILSGQDFFERLIGQQKFNQFKLLKSVIVAQPALNKLISHKNIFIGFTEGKGREINYLISTQLKNETDKEQLMTMIRSNAIAVDTAGQAIKLILNDSTAFYIAVEKNLLLVSNVATTLKTALASGKQKEAVNFAAFVKASSRQSKNSLGNLYIDYNRLPSLLKAILPGKLSSGLSVFRSQDAFAALNYNFSKERVYFNGNTTINDPSNYLSLFSNMEAQKNTIDNLLPEQTANFNLYTIPDYKSWKVLLDQWFTAQQQAESVKKIVAGTVQTYRLNADQIFPAYFKNQLISFQLNNAENIAAINFSNGDKVKQLLIDISDNYDEDIKKLKVKGLLYCYFGEPLKKFESPYYLIIDNYMVFANQASALRLFLNSYRNNQLLINTPDYISLYSQISAQSNITFYASHKNSMGLLQNTVYPDYYKHLISKEGLGNFSSMVYQLSGDKGKFQTNLLINTLSEIENKNIIPN
jgi:hypothetical protein